MPKCLNALCVWQLEIEVTISSNTTIFVKFSGVFLVVLCFLGFFFILWPALKM